MAPPPRPHAPRQARSRATLARLLDATEALLEERSLDDISVSAIVRRARSSVGSFYTRFPGKEALAVALLGRFHGDVQREIERLVRDPEWNGATLGERARRYVERVVELARRRRGLLRLRLERRLAGADDSAAAAEPGRNRELVAGMRALFASCRDEIRHDDPERALAFALRSVDAVVMATIGLEDVYGSFGPIDDDELAREATEAFVRYLAAG